MRYLIVSLIALGCLVVVATTDAADGKKLPVIDGKETVATVNDEPITSAELEEAFLSLAANKTDDKDAREPDRSELIDRLVTAVLVMQESRRMGLDDAPEIKNMVDVFSKVTLREELMDMQVKNVVPDSEEVARLYKEAVKEWKISSVIFEKEEDAKKMAEEIGSGVGYDEAAARYVKEGRAKAGNETVYLKVADMEPRVVEVISKAGQGKPTPPIPNPSGFAIARLDDVRYGENAEEKEKARQQALKEKRFKVLQAYNDSLKTKYAKVHKDVLDDLDYEAEKPGFDLLLADKRIIAEIEGESPITVGELTQQIKGQLYHGVEDAVKTKQVNKKKDPTFDEMLYKRVFRKEALRLGLDRAEHFQAKVRLYENSVIFDAFVQKAVVPDIVIKEKELEAYYQEHLKDYTYPEMVRVNAIAFAKRDDAEAAIEKLRKGADFRWVLENAEGRVDGDTAGLLKLTGRLLVVTDFPEGVKSLVSGGKAGDLKLYAGPEGTFYVLLLQETVRSKSQPFEQVKGEVTRKVFNVKLENAMKGWTDKLRAASTIKIYLKETR